jgi:hypothetical protein
MNSDEKIQKIKELVCEQETQPIIPSDVEKAKKKGGLFGDPVLIIE